MNIEQRVESLEKSVRRWQRGAVVLGALTLTALVAAAPVVKPIFTEAVMVKSEKTESPAVAMMMDDKQNGMIGIHSGDENNKSGIQLSVDENDGGHIIITNRTGRIAWSLSADSKGANVIQPLNAKP
jgi:hypothetical protein